MLQTVNFSRHRTLIFIISPPNIAVIVPGDNLFLSQSSDKEIP